MKLLVRFLIYRVILKTFLRFIIGVKFPETSAFPKKQFLLVANHNSHLDTLSLLCALPTDRLLDVHPVAAADYFARNKVTASLCEFFINTVFVKRKGESQGKKPIDELDDHVKSGKSLILFPEGTRGRPEELVDFKNGAAILLQRNPHVELLPVFMKGMGKALPKGDGLLLPMECEMRVGKAGLDKSILQKTVPEVTQFIQALVLELSKDTP